MGIISFSALLNLFFPVTCAGCHQQLHENEEVLCFFCTADLPHAKLNENFNPVQDLFKGIIPIKHAYSIFQFHQQGKMQRLIHLLKYEKQAQIGVYLGAHLGNTLQNLDWINTIDLVVPVPVHKSKIRKRGYNQSEMIVEGMLKHMNVSSDYKNLYRKVASPSQTKKSRFGRWKNVDDIFGIKQPNLFQGKHILLIDDVVTTGSTLIACSKPILTIPDTKVSIATLAYA